MNSMTGFGRGTAADGKIRVEVELSSVNRKQFDVAVALPHSLAGEEAHVQALVHERVKRGYVKGSVRLVALGPVEAPRSLVDAAAAQVAALRAVASELGLRDDLSASALLSMEEFQTEVDVPFEASSRGTLDRAVGQALDALCAMRSREGEAMEADLRRHLDGLREMLPPVRERAPLVPSVHRAALLQRLREAELPVSADDPAVVREIALFTDRCDISEELARIDSHFEQAERLFAAAEPVGRALDFLCQEFHREITTLGNKALDAGIAAVVVRFKAELEAFREQVQNIE